MPGGIEDAYQAGVKVTEIVLWMAGSIPVNHCAATVYRSEQFSKFEAKIHAVEHQLSPNSFSIN